jgi:hypothetical protein
VERSYRFHIHSVSDEDDGDYDAAKKKTNTPSFKTSVDEAKSMQAMLKSFN